MKMFIEFWVKILYNIKKNFIKRDDVGSWINQPQEKTSYVIVVTDRRAS
jgi:hypothetical protein